MYKNRVDRASQPNKEPINDLIKDKENNTIQKRVIGVEEMAIMANFGTPFVRIQDIIHLQIFRTLDFVVQNLRPGVKND